MLAATLYFADDQLVAVACAMIYAAQLAILLRLRPCMSLAPAAHERQHAALCRSLLALCAACLRPISSQPSQLSKACALVTPSHSSRDGCGSCTHRCGRRLTDRAVPRRRQGRSHLDVPRLLAGRFHRYHRESLTASDRLRRRRQRLRGRPLRRASALVDRRHLGRWPVRTRSCARPFVAPQGWMRELLVHRGARCLVSAPPPHHHPNPESVS